MLFVNVEYTRYVYGVDINFTLNWFHRLLTNLLRIYIYFAGLVSKTNKYVNKQKNYPWTHWIDAILYKEQCLTNVFSVPWSDFLSLVCIGFVCATHHTVSTLLNVQIDRREMMKIDSYSCTASNSMLRADVHTECAIVLTSTDMKTAN